MDRKGSGARTVTDRRAVTRPMARSVRPVAHDAVVGWLLLAAAALLLVRVQLAASPALWIDEAFSLYHARRSLHHLWTEGWRLESSPPLYYTALWAWVRLVGDGEHAARLLSVLLSAVTAAFGFRTARALGGPRAGAAAAVIVLLPTLGLEYSVEIRPYAMQLCLIAIATSASVDALLAWRRGALAGPSPTAVALAPIVVAATATFYTHSTSFAFLAGLAAAGLYAGLASRARARYVLTWAIVCALVVALCLPQVASMLGVLSTNRSGLAWIPPSLDPVALSRVARQLVLGQLDWGFQVSVPIATAFYATVAAAAWRLRSQSDAVAFGVVLPGVALLVLLAADLVQPVLLHRTALWLWLPMSILLGIATARIDWSRPATRVAAIGLLAASVATSGAYLDMRREQRPWHDTLRELDSRIDAGDRLVFVDPEVACVVEYYARGTLSVVPRVLIDVGAARRFTSGQRLDLGCNRLVTIGPDDLGRAGGADWVLLGDTLQRLDVDDAVRRLNIAPRIDQRVQRDGATHALRVDGRPGAGRSRP